MPSVILCLGPLLSAFNSRGPLSANSGHSLGSDPVPQSRITWAMSLFAIATHVLSVPYATTFDALAFVAIDNSQIRPRQEVAVCAMSLPRVACRRPDTPQGVLTGRHRVEVRGPDARTESAEMVKLKPVLCRPDQCYPGQAVGLENSAPDSGLAVTLWIARSYPRPASAWKLVVPLGDYLRPKSEREAPVAHFNVQQAAPLMVS
jgi:hypothetical protein